MINLQKNVVAVPTDERKQRGQERFNNRDLMREARAKAGDLLRLVRAYEKSHTMVRDLQFLGYMFGDNDLERVGDKLLEYADRIPEKVKEEMNKGWRE